MIAHVLDALSVAADDLGIRAVDTAIVVGHRAEDVRTAVIGHLGAHDAAEESAPPEPRTENRTEHGTEHGTEHRTAPRTATRTAPSNESLVEAFAEQRVGPSAELREVRLGLAFPVQAELLGTGHAALQAESAIARRAASVVILCGDTPLITGGSVARLVQHHVAAGATISFLTARVADPGSYGRVIRDLDGRVERIVEAKHIGEAERSVDEVNTGVYAVSDAWLWAALRDLDQTPGGEIYLTDLIVAAVAQGRRVEAVVADDALEFLGVDTRSTLAQAERVLRDRIRTRHLDAGVTMIDPPTTWIDAGVMIGPDTELWPGCYLLGDTIVGEACLIGPDCVLRDSRLDDGSVVEHSVLEGAIVGAGCHVGPFSHLRPGAVIEAGAHVGNFVEVKNSRLGAGARIGHFGYLGDADVGEGANIGAGTVTCNYDGRTKHRTSIGRGAFIGSDTMLVAPVSVGDGARTGAGSVVTRDVAPGTTVAGAPARPLRPERESHDGQGSTPSDDDDRKGKFGQSDHGGKR